MNIFTRKIATMGATQWLGGQNELVVLELKALGYMIRFQTSKQATEEVWDDETQAPKTIPGRGVMAVVGPRNWESTYVEPGEYVQYHFRLADEDETPCEVGDRKFDDLVKAVKDGDLTVYVTTVKAHYLADTYHQVP